MPIEDVTSAYWAEAPTTLIAALGSGPDGLSAATAAQRLRDIGPNRVDDANELGPVRLLLRQFESPLVLILIFAAIVSLGLRQWIDASIILAIVCGSSLLGFLQEYRASAAVRTLKQRLALTCRVWRDGTDQRVPLSQVVPGDLLLL